MYAFLAIYWAISRVVEGWNSSDIIRFCLHFIKKLFIFSNGSCLKDLLFSIVSSSINGSFLLLLNLTTSGSSIVWLVQGCEECARQLSEICTWWGDHMRQHQDSLISDTPWQGLRATVGVLLLFVFFLHTLYTWALCYRQCSLLCSGWKNFCFPWNKYPEVMLTS